MLIVASKLSGRYSIVLKESCARDSEKEKSSGCSAQARGAAALSYVVEEGRQKEGGPPTTYWSASKGRETKKKRTRVKDDDYRPSLRNRMRVVGNLDLTNSS